MSCNQLLDVNLKCGKPYGLHGIYFHDPNSKKNCELINICRYCYDILAKEMQETITARVRDRENLKATRNRQRAIAKAYGAPYNDHIQFALDDVSKLIYNLSTNTCKNIFCNANLLKLPIDSKIYTATTFKPSGRRHYTWNFCSEKCFKSMKGKCGVKLITTVRQEKLI
jgi:hypothetical protein